MNECCAGGVCHECTDHALTKTIREPNTLFGACNDVSVQHGQDAGVDTLIHPCDLPKLYMFASGVLLHSHACHEQFACLKPSGSVPAVVACVSSHHGQEVRTSTPAATRRSPERALAQLLTSTNSWTEPQLCWQLRA